MNDLAAFATLIQDRFGIGVLLGIETGPGAIVTGAVGAIVFGAAGYVGAD